MTEPVSLADLKTHLRVDQGDAGDDGYLSNLIVAARTACEARLARSVSVLSVDETAVVAQAMSLLCGHWFRNREAVTPGQGGALAETPLAVSWLLEPLRQWPSG